MRGKKNLLRFLILICVAYVSSCSTPTPTAALPTEIEAAIVDTQTETVTPTQPVEPADIIFHNGNVITIEKSQPLAEAVAIRGNLIQAVGTDEEVMAYQGADTVIIDLQGNTLMPGFIDGHTHIHAFHDRMGRSLAEAQEIALLYGFTSVNEMWANEDVINKLLEAEKNSELRLRVNVFASYNDGILDSDRNRILMETWYPKNDPILDPERFLRIPGIKIFVDGDNGSFERGCWALSEPFEPGAPSLSRGICGTNQGDLYWDQGELNTVVLEAQKAGYRVAFHAMGDQAIETALNAIEYALSGETNDTVRHQIEHNSLIRQDQLKRYENLDIIVSVRGYGGVFCDLESLITPFGEDRYLWYANRYALPNLDIHAYFETDFAWTVDPMDRFAVRSADPIMQIYGIVTYNFVMEDGSICEPSPLGSISPISIERALQMLTIEPAYAVSMEGYTGSLKLGKYADLIILSDNPLTMDPDELLNLKVWMTMVNGEVKYCADGQDAYCPFRSASQTTTSTESKDATPAQPAEIIEETAPETVLVKYNCDTEGDPPPHFTPQQFVLTKINWAATTEQQLDDFLSAVEPKIYINEKQIPTSLDHDVFKQSADGRIFSVLTYFDVGKLQPGEYEIRTVLTFKEKISDGFDDYGPGTKYPTLEGTCTVIID